MMRLHSVFISFLIILMGGMQALATGDSTRAGKARTDSLFMNPFGISTEDNNTLQQYRNLPDSIDTFRKRPAEQTNQEDDSLLRLGFDNSYFMLYESPDDTRYELLSATITQPEPLFREEKLIVGINYKKVLEFFEEYHVDLNVSKSVIKVRHYKNDTMFEFYMKADQVVKIRYKRPLGSVKK